MSFSTFKLYKKIHHGTRSITRRYVATLNATAGQGYTSGTGENIDFTAVTNPSKLTRPVPPGPPAAPLPANDDIIVVKIPYGYTAVISQAAASPTLKNYNMRIYSTAATELATADYPAGLTGADVVFDVITPARYS